MAAGGDLESARRSPAGRRRRRSRWCSRRSSCCRSSSSSSSASGTTTTTQMLPTFTTRSYVESFDGCLTDLPNLCTMFKTYVSTVKFCFIVWALTLVIGFTVAYFLAFHVRSTTMQIGAVPRLHHPVLDLERHPHDLVDPAARPQRPGQPGAGRRRHVVDAAARMAAVFADSRSCSPSSTCSPSSWWRRSSTR